MLSWVKGVSCLSFILHKQYEKDFKISAPFFHHIRTNRTDEIMPFRNSLLPGEKLVNAVNI